MDDRDLIFEAQRGDLDAFSEIVTRYQSSVRACLAVRLSNKHEAEDLAQEAFIIAFNKLSEFDADKPFGPWIRSISFNLLRNYWRKHKPVSVGGSAELEMLVDEQIGLRYSRKNESHTLEALKHCIAKLDTSMQELLKLRYDQGLSVGEITKKMQLQHSTMTMRLHRMRDQLRKCIALRASVSE